MDKTKIDKVKEFFNKLLTPEQKEAFKNEFGEITPIAPVAQATDPNAAPTTEPQAGTAKLKDGTVIEYDNLAEGGIVMVVGTDGTKLPAPVGDWELEDGTIITIAEGGKIVTVKAATPVTPEVPPAPTAQSSNDSTAKLVEALRGIMDAKFSEANKKIESLEAENKSLKESFSKQVDSLNVVSAFFNAIQETETTKETPIIKSSKKQNPLNYL